MPSNCPAATRSSVDALFNVTELLQQRWEDSPEDNRKRLELCWGYDDCGDCHRSKGHCGWCAIVSLIISVNSYITFKTYVFFALVVCLKPGLEYCITLLKIPDCLTTPV